MTCKDCIHYEVCKTEKGSTVFYREGLLSSTYDQVDKICGALFRDRSRFVELPCKHGDTVFRIKNGKIEKGVATTFFYGSEFHIVNCRFPKISTGIPFHRFGKTVFLSEKEAEKALKERENNGID